jgi:tRNA-dihydrouridine synthase B
MACIRFEHMPFSFAIGDFEITDPVALAPMAGVTDAPFRRQARQFGPGLVVSEMVTAAAFLSGKPDVRAKARLDPAEQGDAAVAASVQIAGREPDEIAESARRAEGMGAQIIDINMGCPAKKVTSGAAGSALMRDPDHALRLIDSAVGAVSAPVTLKMRLGWNDETLTGPEIASRAEEAGIRMIAVHARTRAQFYTGDADWRRVRRIRAATRLPLLINGDISSTRQARIAMMQSGADGVMIGRAACGAPWLPGEIAAHFAGRRFARPDKNQRIDLTIAYYHDLLHRYGCEIGVRVARKHLAWRLQAMFFAPEITESRRKILMKLDDPKEVVSQLNSLRTLATSDVCKRESAL